MHFDQYAFGRRVKYLRRKRNLTLEQMSSALNISIDHLSRIELGKRGASIVFEEEDRHASGSPCRHAQI